MPESSQQNTSISELNNKWLYISYIWLAILIACCLLLSIDPPPQDGFVDILTKNFNGNMVAGVLTSIYFVFLGLHLNAQNDFNISVARDAAEQSQELLEMRKQEREEEGKRVRFIEFLKHETYHDVRFPDIKPHDDSLGLSYTIEPVRAMKTGELIVKTGEMRTQYLIKVRPLDKFIRNAPERLALYNRSPIREDEYYFCTFYNGEWHMSLDDVGGTSHRFYLSGKVGPVEYSQSANAYVSGTIFDLNYTEVGQLLVNDSGNPANLSIDAFSVIFLLQDNTKNFYIKLENSPAKKIYYTNPDQSYRDDDYFFHIECLGGYGGPDVQQQITHLVEQKCKDLALSIPKVPWYQRR